MFKSTSDYCCLVYATMRNLDKKQRLLESVRGLHKDTMAILQMDVTDQQSIHDAKKNVTEGRIDILGKNKDNIKTSPHEQASFTFILNKKTFISLIPS